MQKETEKEEGKEREEEGRGLDVMSRAGWKEEERGGEKVWFPLCPGSYKSKLKMSVALASSEASFLRLLFIVICPRLHGLQSVYVYILLLDTVAIFEKGHPNDLIFT